MVVRQDGVNERLGSRRLLENAQCKFMTLFNLNSIQLHDSFVPLESISLHYITSNSLLVKNVVICE